MSFSSDVKKELILNIRNEKDRKCKLAQLSAIINIWGFVSTESYDKFIAIHNDNKEVVQIVVSLINELFELNIKYIDNEIIIRDEKSVDNIVRALGIRTSTDPSGASLISKKIIANNSCKRAYIRMAFVCCGSVNDPEKHYHIEFADSDFEHLQNLAEIINEFSVDMKSVERKKQFVIYCKDAEQIADLLNVMSAYKALLSFEDLRVLREVRNNVNRIVNCETANINRVVNTAVRQIEDIQYIKEKRGLDYLSDNLRAVAEARLENPEGSLKELGEFLIPPISKYGVNHRLNKIHKIAESLKGDIKND